MSLDASSTGVREQIDRSRACVAASRRIIARSRERIGDSLGSIGQAGTRFELPPTAELTDEERVAAAERGEAARQQRAIDQEVRRSVQDFARRD